MYKRKEVITGHSPPLAGHALATSTTSTPVCDLGNTSEPKFPPMLQWGTRRVRSLGGHEKNKQELKSSTGSEDEAEKEEEEHGSEEKDVQVENTHYSKRKLPAKNTRTATLKRRKCQDPICAREFNALREEKVKMRRDMEKVKSKEKQDSVYLKELKALWEEITKLKEDLQKIVSEKQAMNSTIIDSRRGQDGSSSLLPLKMETSGHICPVDQATTADLLSLMSNAQSSVLLGEASARDVDANGVSTELILGEATAGDEDANGMSTELTLRIN